MLWYIHLSRRIGKDTEEHLFEGTRRCVPCDRSHEEVKRTRCAIMLEDELVEEASEDGKLYFDLTILMAQGAVQK